MSPTQINARRKNFPFKLLTGTVPSVNGGGTASLGAAPTDPNEDWAVVIQK